MSETTNIVGIDLGTTFSALAILDKLGVPHVVPNADGERITRSVAYLPPGEKTIMVGEEAWNLKAMEPAFVREEVKRKMGTGETIEVGDRTFSPAETSSFILRKVIESAESVHGKIEKAVITVPANFMEKARAETVKAGKLAGIEVEHIVNEPTAAALHYAMHHNVSGRVVVFDLGGGTLDVSLAEIEGMDVEIKTSEGVAKLGGRDFDRLILDWVDRVEKEKNGVEYFETEEDREKAMGEAEKAKKTLAKRDKAGMTFAYRGKTCNEYVTRETCEELISDIHLVIRKPAHEPRFPRIRIADERDSLGGTADATASLGVGLALHHDQRSPQLGDPVPAGPAIQFEGGLSRSLSTDSASLALSVGSSLPETRRQID